MVRNYMEGSDKYYKNISPQEEMMIAYFVDVPDKASEPRKVHENERSGVRK